MPPVFFLSDNGGPTHRNGSRNDPFSGKKGDVHEGPMKGHTPMG